MDAQCNWFKNNNTQLYFILGRSELHWNFPSIPKDCSDIHRFSDRKWVSTMWTVGNLWISETSLCQKEKFQHSSDLPDIKYNCVLLFLNQLYWVFIYDSKHIFSQIPMLKCEQKLLILSFLGRNYWSSVRVDKDQEGPLFPIVSVPFPVPVPIPFPCVVH